MILTCLPSVVVDEFPDPGLGEPDLREDLVGGDGPGEDLASGVPAGDLVAALSGQDLAGGEGAAVYGLLGGDPEPGFDLVDPRGADGGDVEVDVRAAFEPGDHLGGGVGRQVVQDDVNVFARMWLDGVLQEGEECSSAPDRTALSVDLPRRDLERGEQVRSAVAPVVVGAPLGVVNGDREHRLGPVQGLDGFFVHAEHPRAAGQVHQVEPDLVGEPRTAAEFERSLARRSQPFLSPQLRHVAPGDGDAGDTADVLHHLPARSVRQTCLRRWARAGEREHPGGSLFGRRSLGPVGQTADAVRSAPADLQIDRRSGYSRQRLDPLLRGTVGMPQHYPPPRRHVRKIATVHRMDQVKTTRSLGTRRCRTYPGQE